MDKEYGMNNFNSKFVSPARNILIFLFVLRGGVRGSFPGIRSVVWCMKPHVKLNATSLRIILF